MPALHPRLALFDPGDAAPELPVCDHYAGVEARMRKSLELQAELGPVFDVTLDNEDGAPVGGEIEQAQLIAELLAGPLNRHGRVGVRLLPATHPRFDEVASIVLRAARAPAYLMLPKPQGLAEVQHAARAIDALGGAAVDHQSRPGPSLPLLPPWRSRRNSPRLSAKGPPSAERRPSRARRSSHQPPPAKASVSTPTAGSR